LRVVDSGECVTNIRCIEEGGNIRLTFNWPEGVEQVYIFTAQGELDISTADASHGRMFTLQEYKKRGGCIISQEPGVITYYIYPFRREDGEDVCYASGGQNQITHTCRININFAIREKSGRYKNHEITLTSDHPVERDTVRYVKKANEPPRDISDGVDYVFSEMLEPGRHVTRIVRTMSNEYLRLFICEDKAELINLQSGAEPDIAKRTTV